MAAPNILKVAVLAGGELLLDGLPATLPAIAQAMDLAPEGSVVWYYRENAAAEPHPVAMELMKLIISHRLPIRLSTVPDFSDSVRPATPSLEQVFAAVRAKAALRNLVVLRPDGQHLLLPALKPEAQPPDGVAVVERLLPSKVPRNVAVIGDTGWSMAAPPSLQAANRSIPFFGLLMGFSSIGHAVWIFDAATADTIRAGCRGADVLIVDDARLPSFPSGWQTCAGQEMRNRQVLVHDRARYRLRPLDPAK
jgi:hypothetical protein